MSDEYEVEADAQARYDLVRNLVDKRLRLGLSTAEVASRAGVDEHEILAFENHQLIYLATAQRYARALGARLVSFLESDLPIKPEEFFMQALAAFRNYTPDVNRPSGAPSAHGTGNAASSDA